jgi:hypothetical protein
MKRENQAIIVKTGTRSLPAERMGFACMPFIQARTLRPPFGLSSRSKTSRLGERQNRPAPYALRLMPL